MCRKFNSLREMNDARIKVAYPRVVSRALDIWRRARMRAEASPEDDLAIKWRWRCSNPNETQRARVLCSDFGSAGDLL